MKDFFKPMDFHGISTEFSYGDVADMANEKLNKYLESCPVVWFNDDKTMSPYWEASSRQNKLHTHKARLAFIEEIAKVHCAHEPMLKTFDFSCWAHGVCRHCGVSLESTWKEKVK